MRMEGRGKDRADEGWFYFILEIHNSKKDTHGRRTSRYRYKYGYRHMLGYTDTHGAAVCVCATEMAGGHAHGCE